MNVLPHLVHRWSCLSTALLVEPVFDIGFVVSPRIQMSTFQKSRASAKLLDNPNKYPEKTNALHRQL
jgi:hypothetical protein